MTYSGHLIEELTAAVVRAEDNAEETERCPCCHSTSGICDGDCQLAREAEQVGIEFFENTRGIGQ